MIEKRDWLNLKAIREELQLSQNELASLLGVSPRTVQSCEQGWRNLSASTEKALLLVLMIHRHGRGLAELRCWEIMGCSEAQHAECYAYRSGQGSLCWFLIGNKCTGQPINNWDEKKQHCRQCKFFRALLPDLAEGAGKPCDGVAE